MSAAILSDTIAEVFGLPGTCAAPPPSVPLRLLRLAEMPPDEEAVKAAFRAAAKLAHPDLAHVGDGRTEPEEIAVLVWARDVLLRMLPPPVTDSTSSSRAHAASRHECRACKRHVRAGDGRRCGPAVWHRECMPRYRVCSGCAGELPPPRRRWYLCQSGALYCAACWPQERAAAEPWHYLRSCAVCDIGMRPSRRDALYCGDECRRRAATARERKRRAYRRAGRTCATCGETFTAARADARYCRATCRQRAYRQRRVAP